MTDAMPDFDNMTPEEIAEWMESLAKRQGATEGFTTTASMNVAEVDPTTVDQSLLTDTYIPYGWTQEQWDAQLSKEAAEKERKSQTAAIPQVTIAAPAPAAADASSEMWSQDEITEFIMGLPLEKQMQLLEEMGKQQRGEPHIVDQLMPKKLDINTVDQSKISKYVPYGWEEKDWDAYLIKEEAEKTRTQAAQNVAPAVSDFEPLMGVDELLREPALDDLFSNQTAYTDTDYSTIAREANEPASAIENPLDWLAQLGNNDSGTSLADLSSGLQTLPPAMPASDDPLAWLAGLASDDLPAPATLDLNALSGDLFGIGALAEPLPAVSAEPDADMNWLESLAKAQGGESTEFMTPANIAVNRPAGNNADGPGYQPYSFEDTEDDSEAMMMDNTDVMPVANIADSDFDDPEDWLDNLAMGVNQQREDGATNAELEADSNRDPMEVIRTLNSGGDVSRDEMAMFFEAMFERAENEPDEPVSVASEESPLIAATIPDWLQESFANVEEPLGDVVVSEMLENLGLSNAPIAQSAPVLLENDFSAPTSLDWMQDDADLSLDPAEMQAEQFLSELDFNLDGMDEELISAAPIPDWLLGSESDSEGVATIFADGNTVPEAMQQTITLETNDPWVQALDQEANAQPELSQWYRDTLAVMDAPTITDVALPVTTLATPPPAARKGALLTAQFSVEEDLNVGEAIEVPAWLLDENAPVAASVSAAILDETPLEYRDPVRDWLNTEVEPANDLPSWLNVQVDDRVDALPEWLGGAEASEETLPSWLLETMQDHAATTAQPAPVPIIPAAPAPAAPAIVPTRPTAPVPMRGDIAAALQAARTRVTEDMQTGLQQYEVVVRANAALPEIVQDLNKLANDKTHKSNPVVHRVLGDALLRQGNLQDALATYRKALNLL